MCGGFCKETQAVLQAPSPALPQGWSPQHPRPDTAPLLVLRGPTKGALEGLEPLRKGLLCGPGVSVPPLRVNPVTRGTSLVAQGLRLHLPMQVVQGGQLVR